MRGFKLAALAIVVALDVAIVLAWDGPPSVRFTPWVARPPEGYVWEHSLAEWAHIGAEKSQPKKQWVYGWVNRFDPRSGRHWEEQAWIQEPFAD